MGGKIINVIATLEWVFFFFFKTSLTVYFYFFFPFFLPRGKLYGVKESLAM